MSDCGFTLIEVLVTIVILSLAILSVSQILNKAIDDYRKSSDKLTAYYLTEDTYQEIKAFVRKDKSLEYSGTRLFNKDILEYNGKQNPPENILKMQMKDYIAFSREITVKKLSENNIDISENLYDISVKIFKNKRKLHELEWIEYLEK